ncbi:MAG TPA: phytanoyl-CoA dioxygenase family protein [Planctomycetota bacterium]|nr:phytanoyl-CoA dioxygenase family protein [Planctomycetota bacterium]
MELTYEEKRHMFEHGYVKVPGVVPRSMVNAALHAINACVGKGMNQSEMVIFQTQTFCPELRSEPVITNLLNKTPMFELAESLIEPGKVKGWGGQIALRFPSHPPVNKPRPAPHPHIDGTYAPNNGVPKGEIHNFTMLGCVLLSELKEPFSGNFTVWPGTHRTHEAYFRDHGADALVSGMPKNQNLPEPVQIMGEPGDIVFAHYLLGHTAAPNFSPNVRYAIFFRLIHADRKQSCCIEAITDMWLEWPGIRKLFGEKQQPALV